MSEKFGRKSSRPRLTSIGFKVLTIIAASIIISAFLSLLDAQTIEDSAAVRRQFAEYTHTFNTRNPTALAAFFTEDADFVMGNLPELHGRQAIENWWQNYFTKQEPGRKGTFFLNSVRFLADDVALVNIETTTGGRDTRGVDHRIRKARGTWVMHRLNGEWLISAIRGMPAVKDSVVLGASIETAESLRTDIRAVVEAFEDAFDSHNPSAVSAFFRNDADIIVRNNPLVQGKQEIQDWWRDYFSIPRPYKAILIIDEIRTISDDVVQVNVTGTGALPETNGELRPLRQTNAMWVLVREGSDWLIAALRVLPGKDDRIIRKSDN
jgi:uncharacterized protein (TIGR02246 family)